MTIHDKGKGGRSREEAETRAEAEKTAPEKETVLGDLGSAVGEIINDDGRMQTGYTEADYDRDHPDKA